MAGAGFQTGPLNRRARDSLRWVRLTGISGCTPLALALIIIGILSPPSALAQGGQGQQVVETVGPYQVRVVIVPSNLSLGRVQFIVAVLDAATQQPIPDARVVIRTHREGETSGGWALALYIPQAPQHYQAAVHLDGAGAWRAQVEISGSRGDALVEVPPIQVPQMRRFTSGSLVFIGVFAVIALGAAYVLWSAARQGRRRAAAAARRGQGPPDTWIRSSPGIDAASRTAGPDPGP